MHEWEGPEFPSAGLGSAHAEALSGPEGEHPRSTGEDATIERDSAKGDDPCLHRRHQHYGGDLRCDLRAPVFRTDMLRFAGADTKSPHLATVPNWRRMRSAEPGCSIRSATS